MNGIFTQSILREAAIAYACFRVIVRDGLAPADAVCVEASPETARFLAHHPDEWLGRRIREVAPALAHGADNWLARMLAVARDGHPADYTGAPPLTGIPCRVRLFAPGRDYVILLFQAAVKPSPNSAPPADPLPLSSLHDWLTAALDADVKDPDPQLARAFGAASGALCAVVHRTAADGSGFQTSGVAGLPPALQALLDTLDVPLVGRFWPWQRTDVPASSAGEIIVYPDAGALAVAQLPSPQAAWLQQWRTGEAVYVHIAAPTSVARGAFVTLFMPPALRFTAHEACTVLAKMAALHLSARDPDTAMAHPPPVPAADETPQAAQTAAMFSQFPCALFQVDVRADGTFPFAYANAAALSLAGDVPVHKHSEVAGLTAHALFGPERGERLTRQFARCLRTCGHAGDVISFEETWATPQGHRMLRTVLTPQFEKARVVSLQGATWDVTSARRVEETLRGHLQRSERTLALLKDAPREAALLQLRLVDTAMSLTDGRAAALLRLEMPGTRWLLAAVAGTWAGAVGEQSPVQTPDGVWAEAIRTGLPAFHSRAAATAEADKAPSRALPSETAQLCVPIHHNGRIVAVLGVAGRESGYSDEQAHQLRILAHHVWPTIENNRVQTELRNDRDLHHAALMALTEAVIAVAPDGRIWLLNDTACQLTGWSRTQAIGQPLATVLPLLDEDTRKAWIPACAVPDHDPDDTPDRILLVARDGHERPIALSCAPLAEHDGQNGGTIVSFRDVTQARQREESMIHLSYQDALTGLYNRRFFEEEMRRLDTRRNLPITLVMADVNSLKLTNDAFGHQMGDQLLRAAADALRAGCRADDIIARMSGDEFVILLPQTGSEEAAEIVARIQERCASTRVEAIALSISFGWDTKTMVDDPLHDTLKRAEEQMYRQKLFDSPDVRNRAIQTIVQTLHQAQPHEKSRAGHVAELCEAMGRELGLPEHVVQELRTASALYDIGKIAIRDEILSKRGALNQEERHEVQRHAEIGYRIISSVNELADIADYVLLHHENWDGSGYPKGLSGESTPLPSRIIGLADAFDALINQRPYRPALTRSEAAEVIRREAGTKFDPTLVELFLNQVVRKIPHESTYAEDETIS